MSALVVIMWLSTQTVAKEMKKYIPKAIYTSGNETETVPLPASQ